MDGTRFDNLTRSLARARTRRSVLKGLAGGLAAGLTGVRPSAAAQRPARRSHGESCARAADCASYACVDGVCCDTACTGQCESCATGGVCTPITGAPVGGRPACPGDGPCAASCDGQTTTHCAAWPGDDTVCGEPTCGGGVLTTHACTGNGSCVPTTTSCAPFGCDPTGAAGATGCASDAECPAGSH